MLERPEAAGDTARRAAEPAARPAHQAGALARMRPVEKTAWQVMEEVQGGGMLQLLVATTVASRWGWTVRPTPARVIIENPERLGLAQLHQLLAGSGGAVASHCVLLYHALAGPPRAGLRGAAGDQRRLSSSPGGIWSCTRPRARARQHHDRVRPILKIRRSMVQDQPAHPQVQKIARFLSGQTGTQCRTLDPLKVGLRDRYA